MPGLGDHLPEPGEVAADETASETPANAGQRALSGSATVPPTHATAASTVATRKTGFRLTSGLGFDAGKP
ncbi:hypothetical protein [Halorussus pelagicus]|uniref:hypothetical protein n=1 Tax=Halorussus pelagicus TaxID=2505977 RepID=UPI000FFC12DC|nr:hypothetical protein [Halorussus pelagicus]